MLIEPVLLDEVRRHASVTLKLGVRRRRATARYRSRLCGGLRRPSQPGTRGAGHPL
jgi:hypothetical protein